MEITVSLASKLGSIAVHVQEYCSGNSHTYDLVAANESANDPEVKAWLDENRALMPVKR